MRGSLRRITGCICEVCKDMNQIDLDDSSRGSLPADKGIHEGRSLSHARVSPRTLTASRRLIDTSTHHPTYTYPSNFIDHASSINSVNLASSRDESIALVFFKMSENMVKDFADVPQKFVKEGTQVRRTSNGHDRRGPSGCRIRADLFPVHRLILSTG